MYLIFLPRRNLEDFPGSLVLNDPASRARAMGLIPSQETRIPLCQKKKKKKIENMFKKKQNHFGSPRASLHLETSDCHSVLRPVLQ